MASSGLVLSKRTLVNILLAFALVVSLLPAAWASGLDQDADGYTDDVDCNDFDATVYPGAPEVADGKDNDCDGMVDEGLGQTWYRDLDGDGYGTSANTQTATTQPNGYVATSGDCDDSNSSVHPAATEIANGIDDDCDGLIDEGTGPTDNDGDGYGSNTDCDDSDPSVYPGAYEWIDGIDNDCDGIIDNLDNDGDQVYDQNDNCPGVFNPTQTDWDGDGLGDVCDSDDDNDGLDDQLEYNIGTNPYNMDTDGDGLLDGAEYGSCTSPLVWDSDGDGLGDGMEGTYGTNPCNTDTDFDGLGDAAEVFTYGTDPVRVDTDSDGLTDGQEVLWFGTSPVDPDTDADGLQDIVELFQTDTDPLNWDSDGDGLGDGAEVKTHGTDPLDVDTDGDLFADGTEVQGGSDATNPWSVPLPTGPARVPHPAPYDETPVLDDLDPLL